MNIVKENTDALNAVLKVHVTREDYETKVDDILKDYRKKANIPGFRPGKVPFGMIKKMYYKPVLADELNKMVIDSVFKYIVDEKLEILGEPLPAEINEKPIDLDNDSEFDFSFDIGLAPIMELKISSKDKILYYKIKVDEETIDKHQENLLQRYGSFKTTEEVNEKSYLKGTLIQLDDNNNVLENGFQNNEASISMVVMQDDQIKSNFIGKQKDAKVIFDLKKAFPNDTEIAALLKTDKEKAKEVSGNFEYEIKEVTEFEKATLNQELFNKVYGEGNVVSEEEFRKKIYEEIEGYYKNESDYKFNLDTKEYFLKKQKLELPVEFLKRWLLKVNKEKYTIEQIDKEFADFENDMKWQLISNKIKQENKIEVNEEEILNQAKLLALMQYRQYGIQNVPDDILIRYANQILSNEQEKRRVKDIVSDQKVFNYIKENVKLDEKEITFEKFNKLFEETKK